MTDREQRVYHDPRAAVAHKPWAVSTVERLRDGGPIVGTVVDRFAVRRDADWFVETGERPDPNTDHTVTTTTRETR